MYALSNSETRNNGDIRVHSFEAYQSMQRQWSDAMKSIQHNITTPQIPHIRLSAQLTRIDRDFDFSIIFPLVICSVSIVFPVSNILTHFDRFGKWNVIIVYLAYSVACLSN